MPGFKNFIRICIALAPLALTACGDGWVAQPYHGVPYDGHEKDSDDRTAGFGVEYVRANMMPSKGANTEEITTVEKPPAPAPAPAPAAAPVKDAAPIYNKAQEK